LAEGDGEIYLKAERSAVQEDDPDDDAALFRQAVAGTRPLPRKKAALRPPAPPPRARFRRADERAALEESLQWAPAELGVETGEELTYKREFVSMASLRSLQRGRYAIEDELDLHGMVAREARQAVREFLQESTDRGLRCVRLIHGKGRGSGPRGPVLKRSVNLWLRKHEAVLAFCSARGPHGGTGALYILLSA
jgi:DNA-nicking Smr family endonuclease